MNPNKNNFMFLVYLTGLSIVGFLATDMYLPAFDKMRLDLDTSHANISISLSLFLGGYAIAQLLWGPLLDKFGKPKSILLGLGIFMLSSIFIYFTSSIGLLLAFRMLQAIGVCAAAVSWQALVIERYPSSETAKVFAGIMPLVALSPALAPLLGVYLLEHFGWRSIFMCLAFIAVLLMLYTIPLLKSDKNKRTKVENTAPDEKASYISIFKTKSFIGNVLIYSFCSGAFFAWLTGAPFFLTELGYNEKEVGFSFIPQTIAFIFGGYTYRAVSDRVNGKKILPYLIGLFIISVLSLVIIGLFTEATMTTLLIPFTIMTMINGTTYPIVVAEALKPFTHNAGKAAALQNTVQLGACFITSTMVSLFSNNALTATMITMLLTILFVVFGYFLVITKK